MLQKCYTPSPEFDISEDDIIVDAGANVGIFAIYAAPRAQRGKAISIEPDPESFAFLEENIKVNCLNNVYTINAALTEFGGVASLSGGNPGSKTTMVEANGSSTTSVLAVKMEEIFSRYGLNHINLLKIDIRRHTPSVF